MSNAARARVLALAASPPTSGHATTAGVLAKHDVNKRVKYGARAAFPVRASVLQGADLNASQDMDGHSPDP